MSRIVDEEKREMQLLRRMVDLAGQRVLDVGCGDGRMALLIAETSDCVVGVDRDTRAIDQARKRKTDALRASVSFIAEDVSTLSAPWLHAFDVVMFSRSL